MKSKGFTLIELLVVIAIIAILAAILFPVFAKAKARAQQTVCVSNLKQISQAMIMYVNDNNGLLPNAWLLVYYGDKTRPLMSDILSPRYITNKKVYQCPADTGYAGTPYWTAWGESYCGRFRGMDGPAIYRQDYISGRPIDSVADIIGKINHKPYNASTLSVVRDGLPWHNAPKGVSQPYWTFKRNGV
ncbi:MAG: prepilin-type N-terminal cleavage/methylation domain-containing protein, partial [Patescibacteria group bacterium]|nr:prepilin-type N-terminal cleavage/methylation domain-containing protein [Patescibacteria group bacterium]